MATAQGKKAERIAAIILAAGENEICNIPLIKKEITQLRNGGVTDVVVVTGHDGDHVEKELVHRKVTCVRNHSFRKSQMLDSIKLGIGALAENPDKLLILPADIPSVSEETVNALIGQTGMIVVPTHEGRNGHPILIDQEILPLLGEYTGKRGLRGFIEEIGFQTFEVEDKGILIEANTEDQWEKAVSYETEQLMAQPLRADVAISLARKKEFINLETVEFLIAIDWMGSMNKACKETKIPYSRGWTMINDAEEQMGHALIRRQTGGKKGGSSHLTKEGKDLIEKYLALKDEVEAATEEAFRKIFM
ncbi:MAG: NTP transferase domain-containing protein [Anaerovoracaceae bacterium]|jgi:molybdate transport repressor ModE-like protein